MSKAEAQQAYCELVQSIDIESGDIQVNHTVTGAATDGRPASDSTGAATSRGMSSDATSEGALEATPSTWSSTCASNRENGGPPVASSLNCDG